MQTSLYSKNRFDLEEGKVEIDNPVVGEAPLAAPAEVDEGPEDQDHGPHQEPANQLKALLYERVYIKKERDKKREIRRHREWNLKKEEK